MGDVLLLLSGASGSGKTSAREAIAPALRSTVNDAALRWVTDAIGGLAPTFRRSATSRP